MNYELDCWDYETTYNSVLKILRINIKELEMLKLKLKALNNLDKQNEVFEDIILKFLKINFPIIRIDIIYFYHRTRWHSKNDLISGLKSNIDFLPEAKKFLQSISPICLNSVFNQITLQHSSFKYSRINDINNRLSNRNQNGPWFFLFGNPNIFTGNFFGRYLERGGELIEQICRMIEEELPYKNALESFINNTNPFLVKYKIFANDITDRMGDISNINCLEYLAVAIKFLIIFDLNEGKYEDAYCFSLKGNYGKAKIVNVIPAYI